MQQNLHSNFNYPQKLLSKVMYKACKDMPIVEVRDDEFSLIQWYENLSKDEIKRLRRLERKTLEPQGPNGNWAFIRKEYGRIYRMQTYRELFVTVMYPILKKDNLLEEGPDYVTVVVDLHYSLQSVYLNDKFKYHVVWGSDAFQSDIQKQALILDDTTPARYEIETR